MRTLAASLTIIIFSACTMIESNPDIVENKHSAPAFHYLFFNSDSVLKEVYQGYQNVENKIEVDRMTSFHAFSITKTITAVAVMQLLENGKIKLSDTISRHLPEYLFTEPVTIRDLLCHQSGIANPLPLKWTHLATEHADFNYTEFTNATILNHLKLKRQPGEKFAYSNINYLVLGRLIEEISGKGYQDYIIENILKRLEGEEYIGFDIPESNHATGYHPNTVFQNLLTGFLLDKSKMMYRASERWNGFNSFYNNGAAYGGIICTPNALRTYCQELLKDNGVLLSPIFIETMLSEQQTAKGKNTAMTLGWFKGTLKEYEYYCHAGGGGGYYSEVRIYPSLGLGSVIMTNSSGMSDDRILDKLDSEYIKNIN